MGYRHILYILNKNKIDNLTPKDIKRLSSIENRYKILDEFNRKQIIELGKYSDEGYELCNKGIHVNDDLRQLLYYEGDTEFEFINPECLVWLANQYKNRTIEYWKSLLNDTKIEVGNKVITSAQEKCLDYVKDLLIWERYILNDNKENKYCLQTTWKYEYEMFNIIHCYKMIDWRRYYLCIVGG